MATAGHRDDIQSLRGYAVLLVVLHHADLMPLPAGYLGVDVFFVISGFLMTTVILGAVDAGTFSFAAFYARRAKRLLPALYVVTACVAIAAPWMLAPLERQELRPQIAGALTFTANLVLAQQSGYFDTAAATKPLLHLWSLSVEEQFYVLLPALLVVLPRRWRFGALSLGVAASYALSQWEAGTPARFYGLPSRAWELLLGGLGALWLMSDAGQARQIGRRAAAGVVPLALLLLLLAPFHVLPWPHPGPAAALVAVATLSVLVFGAPLAGRVAPLRWLGDRSYALYLVHWPLFAFFENAWMGTAWGAEFQVARATVLGAALLGTEVLYRLVERPLHRAALPAGRTTLATTLGATMLVAIVGILGTRVPSRADAAVHERRPNVGLDAACDPPGRFVAQPACRTSETPTLLLWGDSFAMQLAPGLVATADGSPSFAQATKSACAPLLGLAVLGNPHRPRTIARDCIASNDSVLAYLARTPSITTVVLSSPFALYVKTGGTLLRRDADGTERLAEPSVEVTRVALRATVDAIRALNRRVVLVGPTPSSGVDVARCAERLSEGLLVVGASPQCAIAPMGYDGLWPEVAALLDLAERDAALPVIRLSDVLCDRRWCRTMDEHGSLYRDASHLSYRGSARVATEMGLAARILREAR